VDEPSKPPPLPYEERASFVSRKQYRRLMALTLLNTILLATFVCGPAAQNLIESRWARFQRWQAARWMQKQQRASNAAAANYMLPAETVVYEERPAEAIRLLDAGSWSYTSPWQVYNPLVPPRPWQPAVVLRDEKSPGLQDDRHRRDRRLRSLDEYAIRQANTDRGDSRGPATTWTGEHDQRP
jgi:hypothetical protein